MKLGGNRPPGDKWDGIFDMPSCTDTAGHMSMSCVNLEH